MLLRFLDSNNLLNAIGASHGNDTKQSDDEAPVSELCGMWRTPSLPSHPGPLWPEVVSPDRFLSMGQIELFGI